jgi:hypothetical protein
MSYDADRTREHQWNTKDIPAFKLSKKIYLEVMQSDTFVSRFLLKDFVY